MKKGIPVRSRHATSRHVSRESLFGIEAAGLTPRIPSVDVRWKLDAKKALALLELGERRLVADWMTSGMPVMPPEIERIIKKLQTLLEEKS